MKRSIGWIGAMALAALLAGLPARAKVVYVTQSASGTSHNGASWSTAYPTIAGGLSAAAKGDEVWVAKGTYKETIAITSGVSLYGGFAGTETQRSQRDWKTNPTVLDGSLTPDKDVVTCSATGIVLDGFTVRNGQGGVAVPDGGDAALANNTLSGNQAGAYTNTGGTVILTNNTVSGNSWLGVLLDGTATLTNNVITGNSQDGVLAGGTVTLANNTVCSNGTDGVEAYGVVTFTNNIMAFNGAFGVYKPSSGFILSFASNDVFDNTGGSFDGDYGGYSPPINQGDLAADPKFINRANSDFHLAFGSPCIDAGDGSVTATGEKDRDGKPRILGTRVDIGAYEYGTPIWRVSTTGNDANDGMTWATAKHTVGAALALAQGADGVWSAEMWVAKGTYAETITPPTGVSLYGGFAGTEYVRGQRDLKANPVVLDGSGTSQAVVTCSATGILVDGFTIKNGGNGVQVNRSASTTLSNDTISGNSADGVAVGAFGTAVLTNNTVASNSSVGVQVDKPGIITLTNNTVSGNGPALGSSGHGVYATGTATLTGNAFFRNRGDGVSIPGTATLTNNAVYSNATDGVVVSGSATLINNTVSHNRDGLVVAASGAARLTNNILAFNNSHGVNKAAAGSISDFTYNDAFGNTSGDTLGYAPPSGQGNLSLDPLFTNASAGDFHLQPASPCIDAGDDTVATPGETDKDGKPRILGQHMDMGAYEATPPYSLWDAANALRLAGGLAAATPIDVARLNVVEPDTPTGRVDALDAVRMARKAAGLDPNP